MANSYFNPFLSDATDYFDRWVPSDTWVKALTVQENETFSYSSVINSHSQEINPPLQGFIIHTICSLFPNQLSKWFGIIPNIFFFCFTQLALYFLSVKLFKNKYISVIPVILYGFSWGAINSALLIRSYMILTFFTVFNIYLHYCFLENIIYKNNMKFFKWLLFLMFVTTFLGSLTHYYYLIYAFFVSVLTVFYLFLRKQLKTMYIYSITLLSGVALSFVAFPRIINTLLGRDPSYSGTAPFQNAIHRSLNEAFNAFLPLLNNDLFAGKGKILLFCMVLLIFIKIFYVFYVIELRCEGKQIVVRLKKKAGLERVQTEFVFDEVNVIWPLLFFSLVFTFSLVAKISPFIENRYIYYTYPVCFVLLTGIIYCLFYNTNSEKRSIIVFLVAFLFLCEFSMYGRDNIKFYDLNEVKVQKIIDNNGRVPIISIARDKHYWWPEVSQLVVYSKCSETFQIEDKNLELIVSTMISKKNHASKGIFMFIAGNAVIDKNLLFDRIKSKIGNVEIEALSNVNGHGVLYWLKYVKV